MIFTQHMSSQKVITKQIDLRIPNCRSKYIEAHMNGINFLSANVSRLNWFREVVLDTSNIVHSTPT